MKNQTVSLQELTAQTKFMKWFAAFLSLSALVMAHMINMRLTDMELSFGFGIAITSFLVATAIACIFVSVHAAKLVRYGTDEEWQDLDNVQYLDILATVLVCATLVAFTCTMPFQVQEVSLKGWSIFSQTNQLPLISTYILRSGGIMMLLGFCFLQYHESRKYFNR